MKKLLFSLMSLFMAVPALAEETSGSIQSMPLLTKGLIVTAGGLGGVFLVLILFFLMIKVMHKLLK